MTESEMAEKEKKTQQLCDTGVGNHFSEMIIITTIRSKAEQTVLKVQTKQCNLSSLCNLKAESIIEFQGNLK